MQRLPAERVKIIRGRARIEHPDVALCGQLKEPLQARARMLRTATLITMGEEQGQTRRLPPFSQPRHDELVDHDLRAISEVAELRLPANQRVGRVGAVAVLESQRRILRQRAVVQLEGRARTDQMLN